MSKLPQGILRSSRGKLGNVIFSSWNGIEYVRSKPEKVNNPRTPGQVAQRSKFQLINSIITPLTPFIRVGFSGYAEKMSAYNAAISYNLKNAIGGNDHEPEIKFENMKFSRGFYPAVQNSAIELTGTHTLQISWNAEPIPAGASENDRIVAVVYNENKSESHYIPHFALRAEGNAIINLHSVEPGNTIHCYLSVINDIKAFAGKGKYGVSDSLYLGKLIITG